MTNNPEKIRAQIAALKTQLADAEKQAQREQREAAKRTLERAVRRSGLLAAVRRATALDPNQLQHEFERVAERLRSHKQHAQDHTHASARDELGDELA